MLNIRIVLAAAAVALLPLAAHAAPEVGKPAPAFTAKDIAGKEQSLEAYKGKIVVLEWNNPGCPFVVKHYDTGNMQKLQAWAKEKGAVWVTVNSSAPGKQGNMDAKTATETLAKEKAEPASYILDTDGKIGKLYGATATPHMFVIDQKGDLAYAGAIDDKPSFEKSDVKDAKNYVKAAVEDLLAGKSVEVATTKAYGCSVKYAN